jgi:hypothetical protein
LRSSEFELTKSIHCVNYYPVFGCLKKFLESYNHKQYHRLPWNSPSSHSQFAIRLRGQASCPFLALYLDCTPPVVIMGRHLRPLRVHQLASRMLETGRLQREPPWYRVVGAIPPTTTLVRTLPVQLQEKRARKSARKPSRMFQPQRIVYPEDELRSTFFQDHPWELARPRILVENDGKDFTRYDWSSIQQPGKQLNGERLVP